MQHLNHLPIWRDANPFLLVIEEALRDFPRYHKYILGTELRRQDMDVCPLILRAAQADDQRPRRVQQLVNAV